MYDRRGATERLGELRNVCRIAFDQFESTMAEELAQ